MDHRRQPRRSVTLERLTYAAALRKAARLGGILRTGQKQQIVVTLVLPAGSDFDEYLAATTILLQQTSLGDKVRVTSPTISRRGGFDIAGIIDDLKRDSTVLIIWPAGHPVPQQIVLASDRVVDVDAVRPYHLVAAAKALNGQIVALRDAEEMLRFAPSAVFAAFRPGRPVHDVLTRLAVPELVGPSPTLATTRLDDMVGYGDAKSWGLSLAQDLALWRDGDLDWDDVDRGLLLSGPPGTGKTIFAAALAATCEARLVATSVARWHSAGHLGETLAAMRKSFEEARKSAPCILFLDEIDAIGDRAKMEGEHRQYWTQITNLLLELLDGSEKLVGVVVIGATNNPEQIDPALLRAGRLDRHIEIALPDFEERRMLARLYCGDHLADDDLREIAAATSGFSGADFDAIGRNVRRLARRAGRATIMEDVLSSLPKPRELPPATRRVIAVHEAGHAVVGTHLGTGDLSTVCVPWKVLGHQPAGFCQFELDGDKEVDRNSLLDQIAMLLAGRAAEELVLGTVYMGAGAGLDADLHKASDLATLMEVQLGMGDKLSFQWLETVKHRDRIRRDDPQVAERVERVLEREMERCREFVGRHRSAIEAIAGTLEAKGFIEGGDVVRMLQGETV